MQARVPPIDRCLGRPGIPGLVATPTIEAILGADVEGNATAALRRSKQKGCHQYQQQLKSQQYMKRRQSHEGSFLG